jgi:hypothetical protein
MRNHRGMINTTCVSTLIVQLRTEVVASFILSISALEEIIYVGHLRNWFQAKAEKHFTRSNISIFNDQGKCHFPLRNKIASSNVSNRTIHRLKIGCIAELCRDRKLGPISCRTELLAEKGSKIQRTGYNGVQGRYFVKKFVRDWCFIRPVKNISIHACYFLYVLKLCSKLFLRYWCFARTFNNTEVLHTKKMVFKILFRGAGVLITSLNTILKILCS